MADTKTRATSLSPDDAVRRESGLPGGGKGRKDVTTRHGIFPYSTHAAPDDVDPELRTPASLTDAPADESGRAGLEEVGAKK